MAEPRQLGPGPDAFHSEADPEQFDADLSEFLQRLEAAESTPSQLHRREQQRVHDFFGASEEIMPAPLSLTQPAVDLMLADLAQPRYLPGQELQEGSSRWVAYAEYEVEDLQDKLSAIFEEAYQLAGVTEADPVETSAAMQIENYGHLVSAFTYLEQHHAEWLSPLADPELATGELHLLTPRQLEYMQQSADRGMVYSYVCRNPETTSMLLVYFDRNGKLQRDYPPPDRDVLRDVVVPLVENIRP